MGFEYAINLFSLPSSSLQKRGDYTDTEKLIATHFHKLDSTWGKITCIEDDIFRFAKQRKHKISNTTSNLQYCQLLSSFLKKSMIMKSYKCLATKKQEAYKLYVDKITKLQNFRLSFQPQAMKVK